MIKILFVDDEINLLDSLRRILRKKKDEWSMSFAKGGREAINMMDNHKFDIIVTDYKMPEIDGLKLLMHVKKKYPNTKRIILSGQPEKEIFNKASEIAHVYLSKPCPPEKLISTLEEVIQFNNVVSSWNNNFK